MKKIFYLFYFLSVFLFAQNDSTVEKFMLLKSFDKTLTFSDLESKDDLFEDFTHNSQLQDKRANYWIKIELSQTLKSDRYMVKYKGYDFVHSSLNKVQLLNKYKYTNDGSLTFSFYFDAKRDSKVLYLKVLSSTTDKPTFILQTYKHFYKDALVTPNSHMMYLFFGLISGLMIMVSIYNLAIYWYSREKSFLYYSLMQFCLIFVLIYTLGIFRMSMSLFYVLALVSALLGIFFVRSFFNVKKFFPKIENILRFFMVLIFLDFVHLYVDGYSLLSQYGLFSIFGSISLLIAYLRLRAGFIPAKFFLIGWSLLGISIFLTEHMGLLFGLSPLLFGPPIEAVFLAIALAYKLKLSLDEKKEQEEMLVHQSKLALMGEMIGNISHQWKQPLTYLSYNFMNLREASKRNLLDDAYLCKKLDKADTQLNFMSKTIDNFKDFYLLNKEKELFSLHEASLETLEIMSYQFEQNNIEVQIDLKEDSQLNSYKNEYKQVLLNLLSNAKDAFLERKILKPKITISFSRNLVSVVDNAGGIPFEILKRIYEPYFTTKEGSSGIGLYMSKMIVEKNMNATLTVEQKTDGTEFEIYFKD